jgi:AraC-like DNA-binding protein
MIDWPDAYAASLDSTTCILWLVKQGGVFVSQLSPSGIVQDTWEIPSNSVVLWPMNLPRRISTPQGGEWLSIRFHALVFEHINLCDALKPPRFIQVDERDWRFLVQCGEQLLYLCHGDATTQINRESLSLSPQQIFAPVEQEPMDQWTTQSLTQTIFGVCWRACPPDSLNVSPQLSPKEIPDWLVQVLQQSDRKAFERVGDMAQFAGFSEAQFRRLFLQWVGLPPHQYLHEQRMRNAQRLLESTDRSIQEIAEELGFSNVSHFIQAFKTAFRNTPRKYRQGFRRPVL